MDELGLKTLGLDGGAGERQGGLAVVEANDGNATTRELERVAAVATRQVEDPLVGPELEPLDEEVHHPRRRLGTRARLPRDQQVVVAEERLPPIRIDAQRGFHVKASPSRPKRPTPGKWATTTGTPSSASSPRRRVRVSAACSASPSLT